MARRTVGKQTLLYDLEQQVSVVLSERKRSTAAEILELIRQVNPSGRGLTPSVEQHRYQIKSRLQSLLLRRFGPEVEISIEGGQVGIVRLRHRYVHRGHACHAVIADLDEDVRADVQRQLDTAIATHEKPAWADTRLEEQTSMTIGSTPQTDRHGASDLPWPELVARGRAALADYDYEVARADLEHAVNLSGGEAVAVLPLCELLVENLAADADALRLLPVLSATARADSAVRALLALAAARSGDPKEAEWWLQGVDDARATPARLALIARTLQEGNAEAAAVLLEQGRAAGLSPSDLLPLTEQLQTLRRTTWGAVEEELAQALCEGSLERVERKALDLLTRWPDSPVARKVVAALHDQRKRSEQARLVREADAARSAGHLDRAATLASKARSIGADVTLLERAIATARKLAQEERDEAMVAQVVKQLGESVDAPALLAYLQLGESLRARVRSIASVPVLGWLDDLDLSGTGGRLQTGVMAVLSLQHAASLAEPTEFLAALHSHERSLERVAAFQQLYGAAKTALLLRFRSQAEKRLADVESALVSLDLESAERLLAEVDVKALDLAGRERLQSLTTTLQRRVDLQRQTERFHQQLQSADLLGAKETVDGLVEHSDAGERRTWLAMQEEVDSRLQQAWCLREIFDEQIPLSRLVSVGAAVASRPFQRWRALQGTTITVVSSYLDWLFLWQVDAVEKHLRRAVMMRTPAALESPQVVVTRDGLWVLGNRKLLVLDSTGTQIRAWHDLSKFVGSDDDVVDILPLPDAGFVWLCCETKMALRGVVVDTRRWRVRREVRVSSPAEVVSGWRGELVASLGLDEPPRVFDASGSRLATPDFQGMTVTGIARHPSGDGFIGSVSVPDDQDEEGPLELAESDQRGDPFLLPGCSAEMTQLILTSLSQKRSFAAYARTTDDTAELRAFRVVHKRLRLDWHTQVPHKMAFLQDPDEHRTFALFATSTGCELAELNESPPSVRKDCSWKSRLPSLTDSSWCIGRPDNVPDGLFLKLEALRLLPAVDRETELTRMRAVYTNSPEALFVMTSYQSPSRAADYSDFWKQCYPEHPLLLLQQANDDAIAQRWDAVQTWRESLVLDALPETCRRHALHLCGIERLCRGDRQAARRAWQTAESLPGVCNMDLWLDWLDALSASEQQSLASEEQTFLQLYADRIRTADTCLDCGDPSGARRALEHPLILAASEGQSLARLTAAYLQLLPPQRAERFLFDKALALARFCDWHAQAHYPYSAILPGATWDPDRLKDLNHQAHLWLNNNFPQPQNPTS